MKKFSLPERLKMDTSWSLFLDRDGVINRRIPGDYVKTIDEFQFLPGVLDAFKIFSGKFSHIFVVTNQQGIGKGLMSRGELHKVHDYLQSEIKKSGERIDRIFYAPYLESDHHPMRKPGIGMGLEAKKAFPNVDFKKSIMAGDSMSDMIFGKRLKMKTVFIGDDLQKCRDHHRLIDFHFYSLHDFALQL
ncbi:MAG: HAD-IIIA family hydrolase [Bacteroidales bacterium]|jgi:histidinol-phosphate phosphatase family protein|nr:HAD-IIIA family hydrolase [Bacteroidales bacterium]